MDNMDFIKHKDEIENVLLERFRPSIIGFTETHVTHMVEDHELEINGYVCVRGNSESSRMGGVLLYVDRNIKFAIVALNTCERNWWTITIKISNERYKGMLMLVYHSPSSSDAEFMDFLEETCCNELLNGSVIIMGDFNIDMKVKNYNQNKLMRIMYSIDLKQLVNEPTRIVNTLETIIDLIFTNEEVDVVVKHEPRIVDHSIIILQWNVNVKKRENRTIVCREYKKVWMRKNL